jgi:cell division FtsZ-interacting protein ZapD
MTEFRNTLKLAYTSMLVMETAKTMLNKELDRAQKKYSSSNKLLGIHHERVTARIII